MERREESRAYINNDQRNWMLTQSYTRLMHKQYEDCLTLLRGLRVLCPEDPEVYCMMSYACLEADYPEECLEMVDKYLKCVAPGKKENKEIQWIKDRAQLRVDKKNKSDNENSVAIQ